MTMSELRGELERRRLDLSGTKAALELRLAQAMVVEIAGPHAASIIGGTAAGADKEQVCTRGEGGLAVGVPWLWLQGQLCVCVCVVKGLSSLVRYGWVGGWLGGMCVCAAGRADQELSVRQHPVYTPYGVTRLSWLYICALA